MITHTMDEFRKYNNSMNLNSNGNTYLNNIKSVEKSLSSSKVHFRPVGYLSFV